MNVDKYEINGITRTIGQNPMKTAPGPKKENYPTPPIKKNKKMGRPAKDKKDVLSKKLTVNFTQDEFEFMKKLAKVKYPFQVPLSTLLRSYLKEKGFFKV